jgi:hypothetical protein
VLPQSYRAGSETSSELFEQLDHLGVVPKKGNRYERLHHVIQVMAEAGEVKPPLPAAERLVDLQYLYAAG